MRILCHRYDGTYAVHAVETSREPDEQRSQSSSHKEERKIE